MTNHANTVENVMENATKKLFEILSKNSSDATAEEVRNYVEHIYAKAQERVSKKAPAKITNELILDQLMYELSTVLSNNHESITKIVHGYIKFKIRGNVSE